MTPLARIRCWTPTPADHAWLLAAERLYERAIAAPERIPWAWMERSVIETDAAPGEWRKHLLLAATEEELAGFAFGAFLPGFGGYLAYVAVDERFRQIGLATRLYDVFFERVMEDARTAGEPLPFAVWESHRPGEARQRLFEKVGGLRIDGLDLLSPNFAGGEAVPLTVFLRPFDEPRESFDDARLRHVAAEMLDRLYDQTPGDPLYDRTFNAVSTLRLVQPTKTPPGMTPSNASHWSITSPSPLSTVTVV